MVFRKTTIRKDVGFALLCMLFWKSIYSAVVVVVNKSDDSIIRLKRLTIFVALCFSV